ncbi:alpha-glucosidase [Fomitiporia mediterranea MF3/22]|uniref:alpha-glucosidase n=1 Tax=Fomitiporia mediterranea (strain MF3/22) TaxID=694068 RepID=UPI00044078C5|nr:alpha-glucosidase [Fomitiporia mediterranea MF3/22]EJD08186.1 alpha-glucosidase [Fomitiporia mediterranea MF3/22]
MKVLQLAFLLCSLPTLFALKTGDWKTCSQSAFCRRGRALSARAKEGGSSWKSPYSVDPASISVSPGEAAFSAAVKSSIYPDVKFKLYLQVLQDGVVRVRMDEAGGLRKRYNEAASWALIADPKVTSEIRWTVGKKDVRAVNGDNTVVVELSPLKISLLRKGKEEIVLNGGGLLHMEHFREKKEQPKADPPPEGEEQAQEVLEQATEKVNPAAWFEGEEDGWWEESFKSWTDSKPKGPESLSLDIDFPHHGHLYGIPQHATLLDLPTTTGESPAFEEPYRFMNADVFEYLASSPMSLYGSIPLLYAHSSSGSTVGVFHVIGSETWIDVAHPRKDSSHTHWVSESGILDTFLLPGPTPEAVAAQYARLTGTPVMPAQWALGYHQCRWNYVSSDDVRGVQKRFDEEDIPVDVFWLDIEYAEEHKYFMWDKKNFPDPVDMIKDVEAVERKMVIIIDPHLKRTNTYPVYEEAKDMDIMIKKPDGTTEYEGWCWSGSSAWVDFFHPKSWSWWKKLFKTEPSKDSTFTWVDSTENVGIWNDMNEPSIFNGPEITMQKDSIHYGGWEHRDVHNINGMLFTNQTWQALYERSDPPKRPFVLTRSFYAGSQRYGAMWTGDNLGTWEHMEVGLKMVLSNSLCGMSFSGSDVGGFFGNPEPEMLVRWYQLGAFFPFFRAHAHIDTKRREPYLLDEPYKSIIRDTLRLRYKMLPVWYTAFRETSVTGSPVLRPQFFVFPNDERGASLDDQFYIGSSGLLAKPITSKGTTETTVYLSDKQPYYDYFTNHIHRGGQKSITVKAELDQIPFFIQGGSIIPTRERPRRSSPLMKNDPFTLRVALGASGSARGELYLDDGDSYAHERGELIWREFNARPVDGKGKKGVRVKSVDLVHAFPSEAVDDISLTSYDPTNPFAESVKKVKVERVVVLGLSSKPTGVKAEREGRELEWEFVEGVSAKGAKEGTASVLTIRNPGLFVAQDWDIVIE